MTQITNTQNIQLDPMKKFEASGAQWCYRSESCLPAHEITYGRFLYDIYGKSGRYSHELSNIFDKTRNNTRTTQQDFRRTVLNRLEPYLEEFPQEKSIPLLVFAYCNEVAAKDGCGETGTVIPGWTATLLRLDLLQRLSSLKLPPFCVEMLRGAAAYCDEREKGYIESIAKGVRLDIPQLRPVEPETSLPANPGPPTPATPLTMPAPVVVGIQPVEPSDLANSLYCALAAEIVKPEQYAEMRGQDPKEATPLLKAILEDAAKNNPEKFRSYLNMMSSLSR